MGAAAESLCCRGVVASSGKAEMEVRDYFVVFHFPSRVAKHTRRRGYKREAKNPAKVWRVAPSPIGSFAREKESLHHETNALSDLG